MNIRWEAVAIGAAVVVSVAGAVIAFQPDPVWDGSDFYTYELTRMGPPPERAEYRWLVTVEGDRVASAVLKVQQPGFDPIGYGLPTLADLLDVAERDDNYGVTYEDGAPTSFCYTHPEYPEWDSCEEVSAITPMSAEDARGTWSWVEPRSYSVTVRTESVTWELWMEWRVVVENGVVTDTTFLAKSDEMSRAEPPTEGVRVMVYRDPMTDPYWTAYWREGEPNPAAVCLDDPNIYDEETCYRFSDYEINP